MKQLLQQIWYAARFPDLGMLPLFTMMVAGVGLVAHKAHERLDADRGQIVQLQGVVADLRARTRGIEDERGENLAVIDQLQAVIMWHNELLHPIKAPEP